MREGLHAFVTTGAKRTFSACVGAVLFVLLMLLIQSTSLAQSWVASAQKDGFTLKKVVSDTTIRIGQPFSYTVYFSIPAGATNVSISDMLPNTTRFISSSFLAPGTTPIVSAPQPNDLGGQFSMTWTSVPTGCSGSFTITTQFENGVTCNGTSAKNNVCLLGTIIPNAPTEFCTRYVSTTAEAVNPWKISKTVLSETYIGGSCGIVTPDTVITYKVCVYKSVGTTGQMNLVNGVVTDAIPANAILRSSTCGAVRTGNTITWNVGNMSATQFSNSLCCNLVIEYPRAFFPSGSTVYNTAVLNGQLGSAAAPCGNVNDSTAATCVELRSHDSARITKSVTTNKQPGCVGKFTIRVCNMGTTTINAFTVNDELPATLTGYSLGTMPTGLTATLVGTTLTATNTTPLLAGQCRQFVVHFTIPTNAVIGSTITNCAQLTSPSLPTASDCADFKVSGTTGNTCIHKEVCSEQASYAPGQILRYRMRVQNISNVDLTNAVITDVLNGSLQYVGQASFYTATSWNTPCTSTSNWVGPTISHSPATNTVTVMLPTIPSSCAAGIGGSCGVHGSSGVPFYFIEFDVRVADTTLLGTIPNKFTIGGGNAASQSSNTEYILVTGTAGYTLEKSVKRTGDATYSNAIAAAPGESVEYRLAITPTVGSVALRHSSIIDLLPRDNGATQDNLILGPCTPRGSAFDMQYAAPYTTSPFGTPFSNAYTGYLNVTGFAPAGSPASMFVGGCGTTTSTPWLPSLTAGAENLAFYYGATPVAAGSQITATFSANVPVSTPAGVTACNTFAANAAVRHLINSTMVIDQAIGQLESNAACVTTAIDSVEPPPCVAPPGDMVGWWTLDQGAYAASDDVQDYTGTPNYLYANASNDGEVLGNGASAVAGKVAGALQLDGTTYVSVPDHPSLNFGKNSFTVDVWVNPSDTDGIHAIADKRAKHPTLYQYAGYTLFTYGNKVAFQLGDGPLWINYGSNIPIPMNTWSFISVRVDRTNATITFDVNGGGGANTRTFAISPNLGGVDNGGDLRIGGHQFPVSFKHWEGAIDELEIFNRLLAASELTGIYAAGASGKCKKIPECTIEPPVVDPGCCNARFTIPSHPVGIVSIDYTLSSGSVHASMTPISVSTSPCFPSSTNFTASTGSLNYGVPCTSLLNLDMRVSSPTGVTTVTLQIRYADGTGCVTTHRIICERPAITKCDRVEQSVWPRPVPSSILVTSRRFSIVNEKVPASPISHVKIMRSPTNATGGRDVSIDGGPWILGRFVAPFTRIPNETPNASFCTAGAGALNRLDFTLDAPVSWSGSIQFVVYHCDGDSCVPAPITWSNDRLARLDDHAVKVVNETPADVKDVMYMSHLQLRATDRWTELNSVTQLKSIEINMHLDTCNPPIPDCPRLMMQAISGGWQTGEQVVEDSALDSSERNVVRTTISKSSGVIEFRKPINLRDSTHWPRPLRVLYTGARRDTLNPVQMHFTLYDENHEPILFDSVLAKRVVLAVQDADAEDLPTGSRILGVYPNPASSQTKVEYELEVQQDVTLELCDLSGRTLSVLDKGWRSAGTHQAQLQSDDQTNGVYLIRLRTAHGSSVVQLRVVR